MEPDTTRLGACLSRLLRHVDRGRLALTGSVAIEVHLAAAARPSRRERLTDVDFIASDLDVIAPSVAMGFLVSHSHVAQVAVPKALVQLVDLTDAAPPGLFP